MTRTLLLVDDEPAILRALEQLFCTDGDIDVLTADSSTLALSLLKSNHVDLVLTDQPFPTDQGNDLVVAMRRSCPGIGIALLTETGEAREEIRKELGRDPLTLQKPWDSEQLVASVREELARSIEEQEQAELQRIAGVSVERLERARRIRDRMQQSKSLTEILVQLGDLTEQTRKRVEASRRKRMSLAAIMRDEGSLSAEGHARYRDLQEHQPELSDREILVDEELVTPEQFLRAYAVQQGLAYLEPDVSKIDTRLVERTSLRYLIKHEILPVQVYDSRLEVICSDPTDTAAQLELERIFCVPISLSCCVGSKIVEALRVIDRLRGDDSEEGSDLKYRALEEVDPEDSEEHQAVQIVDYILQRSIQLGASDLHVEPQKQQIRVRVRVDGILQKLTEFPIDYLPRLASRVKVLAGCDIAEKRLHQDGKIQVSCEGREVDVRVSTYVTIYGENLVLRLLDRTRNLMGIKDVGFQPRVHSVLEDVVLRTSSGLVLITGPTGSGKTSTLYSLVSNCLDPKKKVITCEDPVEYVVDSLVQCSVNEKTGPTFAASLKAILRQDPDTIVVGEMRDPTTASLAFECAMTGHKVYSTFHTEDAVTVVIRLLEMQVEPFTIASTLSAVIAQRLLRRLCSACRQEVRPTRTQMRFLNMDRPALQGAKFYEAEGCGRCEGTGFRGRLAVHEVMMPGDDFRDAVLRRAPAKQLREHAKQLPEFLSLQEDSIIKAANGLTSLGEIVDNVPRDVDARDIKTLRRIAGNGEDRG